MAIAKASTDSKQNMINKLMKENIDWKMYRIPPKDLACIEVDVCVPLRRWLQAQGH